MTSTTFNAGGDAITTYPLSASGDASPVVTDSTSALFEPYQVAFEDAGDLWAANASSNTVVEFTPSQLGAGGSPTPAVTISAASTALADPAGLAIAQAPTVISVSPGPGPAAGGSAVSIEGTGLLPGSSVDFGTTPVSTVADVSSYEVKATTPAGAGTVNVTGDAAYSCLMGGEHPNAPVVAMAES